MRFALLAVLFAAALFSTPAVAQVHEGGDVSDVSVKASFPGLMEAISNPDALREISKFTARGGAELKDIKHTEHGLKMSEYTFEFGPKNGSFIGSSSFTVEVRFSQNGKIDTSFRRNPDLELPMGR